jgi:adenylate kinase family enzyme
MNHKPKLVIVTGQPGSGKTTLSKELGKLLYLPVISRDEIKEGYVNTFNVPHHKLPGDTNKIATGHLVDPVKSCNHVRR